MGGGTCPRAACSAYLLDTGARLPDADFDTLEAAGNLTPRGLWSDGDTLWVTDWSEDKVFAYQHLTTPTAKLASLAVTGAELAFDPAVLDHAATVGPAFEDGHGGSTGGGGADPC